MTKLNWPLRTWLVDCIFNRMSTLQFSCSNHSLLSYKKNWIIYLDRFEIFSSYWNVKNDDSRVKAIQNLPPNHFSLCMLKVEGFIFYDNLGASSQKWAAICCVGQFHSYLNDKCVWLWSPPVGNVGVSISTVLYEVYLEHVEWVQ